MTRNFISINVYPSTWRAILTINLVFLFFLSNCNAQSLYPNTGLEKEINPLAGWETPKITWSECQNKNTGKFPLMQCATLTVPIDWSNPNGPSIDLRLVRIKARAPQESGRFVLALSGGPGMSGIDDLPYITESLPEIWDRFDLLAHEPRTAQALRTLPDVCLRSSGAIMDIPKDSIEYKEILESLVLAIQQCRSTVENDLIDHLDGRSQALDVEALRRAMAAEQLNLIAQSYGGVVVASYARMFPSKIRAAYVDGVVSHPDYPFVRGHKTQEDEFKKFATWCSMNPECALYGEDVQALWLQLTKDANREPIPGRSDRFGEVRLSGAQLHFLIRGWRNPGHGDEDWIKLSQHISQARNGDASAFVDWTLGNLIGWASPVGVALQCPDGAEGIPGYQSFRMRMEQYQRDCPLLYGVKLLGMTCEAWPLPLANPPLPLPEDRLPPFLGAGTTANDYESTAQFLEHIPGSVAIMVPGTGHVVYLGGATETAQKCVRRHLTRYLDDLTLPPVGTQCN